MCMVIAQDDCKSFEALVARLAQLNVTMNGRAKAHLISLYEQKTCLQECPASLAYKGRQCVVNGKKITSNLGSKSIPRAVSGSKLRSHLVKKQCRETIHHRIRC
jgi:hypothetical protein